MFNNHQEIWDTAMSYPNSNSFPLNALDARKQSFYRRKNGAVKANIFTRAVDEDKQENVFITMYSEHRAKESHGYLKRVMTRDRHCSINGLLWD